MVKKNLGNHRVIKIGDKIKVLSSRTLYSVGVGKEVELADLIRRTIGLIGRIRERDLTQEYMKEVNNAYQQKTLYSYKKSMTTDLNDKGRLK